jgi:hypothetical protein
VKFLRHIFGLTLLLALCACRQEVSSKQFFRSTDASTAVSAKAPPAGTASTSSPVAVAQTSAANKTSAASGEIYIDASIDYGAELLLVDSQGHQTGYDPSVHHKVTNLAGASYVDESITDATDDSDDPATGESKVLHFTPAQGSSYFLHVFPKDRSTYGLEFKCKGPNGSTHLHRTELGISSGEEHVFSISLVENCSERCLTGVFANASAQGHPLLTYAFPISSNVRVTSGTTARIVIVYDKDILPSSFIATLNGQTITQLFHPKTGSIESVAVPTKHGENILQLGVTNSGNQANHSMDSFTIHVD